MTLHKLGGGAPYKARVQNGISGSYMDAIFELVAYEKQTGLPYAAANAMHSIPVIVPTLYLRKKKSIINVNRDTGAPFHSLDTCMYIQSLEQ